MRYVALLRGINVGGRRKVEMSRLAQVFESVGFTNVVTYINSGNVVFDAADPGDAADAAQRFAKRAEGAIRAEFGFDVRTLVVARQTMNAIGADLPDAWRNDKEMKCDVLFVWDDIDVRELVGQLPITAGIDHLRASTGAVIWMVDRADQAVSGLAKLPRLSLSGQITARNANTFRALVALVNAPSEQT